MKARKKRKTDRQRGQSLIEFALTLPVVLLFIVGIFDLGIGIWQYNTVSSVARESARWAVVRSHQPLTEADFLDAESNVRSNAAAIAAGRRQAYGLNSSVLDIHIYPADDWEGRSTWGMVITATAIYTFSPITGLVPQGAIVMRATSMMVTE